MSTIAGSTNVSVYSSGGLAGWRNLIWFYKPEVNGNIPEMMKYDSMILTRGDEATITALRNAGYKGQIWQYVNGSAIQNTTGTPNRNQVAWNVGDWTDISNNHDDWFLKDSNGNRVPQLIGSTYYMMDPASTGWQNFFVSRVNAFQATGPFNGLFMDNIEGSLAKREQQGQTLGSPYTSDSVYQAAVKKFLVAVMQGVTLRPINGNVINVRGTSWTDYLTVIDGAMNEASFVNWHTGYLSTTGWLADLALAVANKKVVFVCQSDSQTDNTRQQFCYASYLMICTPNTSFRFTSAANYNVSWWYSNYDKILGKPLGAYSVNGSVYTRQFQYGTVTVNPVSHASTITVKNPVKGTTVVSVASTGQLTGATIPAQIPLIGSTQVTTESLGMIVENRLLGQSAVDVSSSGSLTTTTIRKRRVHQHGAFHIKVLGE